MNEQRLDPDRIVMVTLPLSHWQQIVSDIEAVCGRSDDIEILSSVRLFDPAEKGSTQAGDERG